MRFQYYATKVGGRFSGSVSVQNEDGTWKQIGTLSDLRSKRAVKGVAKSIAAQYREDAIAPEAHTEIHALNGSIEL